MGYSLRLRHMQKILAFLPGEQDRPRKAIQISAESQGYTLSYKPTPLPGIFIHSSPQWPYRSRHFLHRQPDIPRTGILLQLGGSFGFRHRHDPGLLVYHPRQIKLAQSGVFLFAQLCKIVQQRLCFIHRLITEPPGAPAVVALLKLLALTVSAGQQALCDRVAGRQADVQLLKGLE